MFFFWLGGVKLPMQGRARGWFRSSRASGSKSRLTCNLATMLLTSRRLICGTRLRRLSQERGLQTLLESLDGRVLKGYLRPVLSEP